jgi:hypothetical protein
VVAILRRIETPLHVPPNVETRIDLPGHEASRILHGGSCPLRGQIQHGGVHGPFCSLNCIGPTPPVYIESTYEGMVIGLEADHAIVWNFLTKKPESVRLNPDPVFPDQAIVDATPDLLALYDEWLTWRKLEVELRQEAVKRAEEAKKAAKEKTEADKRAAIEAARLAEEAKEAARQRMFDSRIRAGCKLRVVSDPPGLTEKNRGLKPKNRTPSMIGLTVHCVDPGYGGHVFVKLPDGPTKRIRRAQVRVILKDGTLGDEDREPGVGRGSVLSDD